MPAEVDPAGRSRSRWTSSGRTPWRPTPTSTWSASNSRPSPTWRTAPYTAATVLKASVVSQSWGLLGRRPRLLGGGLPRLELLRAGHRRESQRHLHGGVGRRRGGRCARLPSVSPTNVSVGGTSLEVTGNTWVSETGWSDSGGGISQNPAVHRRAYQEAVFGRDSQRTSPDISADANPAPACRSMTRQDGGWFEVGGTSVATPIWSGTDRDRRPGPRHLWGQAARRAVQTLPALYSYHRLHQQLPRHHPGQQRLPRRARLRPGHRHRLAAGQRPAALPDALRPRARGHRQRPGRRPGRHHHAADDVLPHLLRADRALSVVAGDFTVNGVAAISDSLSPDDTTITYTFTTSPVTQQGSESMYLPAGSVVGQLDGQPNHVAFSASFYYVNTQLQVTSTSPAVGSVLTIPVTSTWSSTSTRRSTPTASRRATSRSARGRSSPPSPLTPTTIDLTLSGVTQDGTLTLTVPAGALLDSYGVPNPASPAPTSPTSCSEPYPVPLQASAPPGSLIYDPSVSGTVGFVGDTDTYTLSPRRRPGPFDGPLDRRQPDRHAHAARPRRRHDRHGAPRAGPGTAVTIQAAPITAAGTYSLVVGGSGGTTGAYTLQAILNAVSMPARRGTTRSARPMTSARPSELGTTPYADRAGVVGTLARPRPISTPFPHRR